MPTHLNCTTLTIIGSGGHASVVIDAARLEYPHQTLEVFDTYHPNRVIEGLTVCQTLSTNPWIHVAIGANSVRQHTAITLGQQGKQLYSVIHPRAVIAASASLNPGCFVAANAIIAPNATVGMGCIINHNAVVDHDNTIGDWTHIAPNATLGGNVTIGIGCLIGAGAVILPGMTIGDNVTVGAGAVVTHPVLSNQTVVGVPARVC